LPKEEEKDVFSGPFLRERENTSTGKVFDWLRRRKDLWKKKTFYG
jgi:hypothetical protein